MLFFSDYPIKELLCRLLTLFCLLFAFKIVITKINSRNIESIIPCEAVARHFDKKFSLSSKNPKKVLAYVDKLNAYIEEQEFLLSQTDKDDVKFEQVIDIISQRLDEIEKKAEHKKIKDLIDQPTICELKSAIKSYRQVLNKEK